MAPTLRKRPTPVAARPRTRGAVAAPVSADPASIGTAIDTALHAADPAEQLRLLKLNLQTTREALMRVDPDTLGNADHAAWTQQIFQVSLAINSLRNAALDALTAGFTAALPGLQAATTTLGDTLAGERKATAILQAVGAALAIIATIPVLLP